MSSDTDLDPDMTDPSDVDSVGQYHHENGASWLSEIDVHDACNIQVFQENLPSDAPVALCLGDCGSCVYKAGVLTIQLTFTTASSNITALLDSASNVFQDIFRVAKRKKSKGVYLVGFGFGALIAAKLLSDRQFFKENRLSNLFQAAYLISGLYDVNNQAVETVASPGGSTSPTTCGSVQKNTTNPSLMENLIIDKQSFDDRKNLSFICDFSSKSPVCGEFFTTNELKKFKQVHGIHATHKENFVNSPVYQSMLVDNKVASESSVRNEIANTLTFDKKLNCSDNMELYKMLSEESEFVSPINDDFTHLCPMGIRLYVFAGENDALTIQKQSRTMYDCISSGCCTGNMHFQIKDKLDITSMRELFRSEDNFLKRLIRYDIVKNL